jgi:hypothetical protein
LAWTAAFYVGGIVWNVVLLPLGGVFGDWLPMGRYLASIGDVLMFGAFGVLLSFPYRRRA